MCFANSWASARDLHNWGSLHAGPCIQVRCPCNLQALLPVRVIAAKLRQTLYTRSSTAVGFHHLGFLQANSCQTSGLLSWLCKLLSATCWQQVLLLPVLHSHCCTSFVCAYVHTKQGLA